MIYGCTNNESNNCVKREECERYAGLKDDQPHTTLWKVCCNEDNNYELYIKLEEVIEEVKETSEEAKEEINENDGET